VRGEPLTIFGSQRKGPKEFGPLVGLFVFVPLMAIAALASLPFLPFAALWERRKTRLLTDAMTAKNRVMQWPEFVQAVQEKRGTLIIEGDPWKGPNFWWTAENVSSLSPHPCSCDLGTLFDRSYRPFRAWCYERYTSPATGSAFLVLGGGGQRRGFAIGSEEDEIGTGIFKDMPTVLTSIRGR
jgi:hypothetical protein